MPKPGKPRFNHVAMSVPSELLREPPRKDIVGFYSDVFGWEGLPTETIDGKQLVLSVYAVDQFVFLTSGDETMRAPRMDHFGLGVATLEELDTFYGQAQDYRARDARVDIIEKRVERHPGLSLTSFYVRF